MRFFLIISTLCCKICCEKTKQYHVDDRVPLCECGERDKEWGSWSDCEQDCSDKPIKQIRKRTCEGERPRKHNRHYCPLGILIEKEYYIQEQFRICEIPLCGEFNYIIVRRKNQCYSAYWSQWEDTTPCSKSCETGIKNQTRYCQRGKQISDISDCEGSNNQQTNCNSQRCREFILVIFYYRVYTTDKKEI